MDTSQWALLRRRWRANRRDRYSWAITLLREMISMAEGRIVECAGRACSRWIFLTQFCTIRRGIHSSDEADHATADVVTRMARSSGPACSPGGLVGRAPCRPTAGRCAATFHWACLPRGFAARAARVLRRVSTVTSSRPKCHWRVVGDRALADLRHVVLDVEEPAGVLVPIGDVLDADSPRTPPPRPRCRAAASASCSARLRRAMYSVALLAAACG